MVDQPQVAGLTSPTFFPRYKASTTLRSNGNVFIIYKNAIIILISKSIFNISCIRHLSGTVLLIFLVSSQVVETITL